MKRLHVHIKVKNLPESIAFYNALFNTEATMVKGDYAKWQLEDPKVNFAISTGPNIDSGIEHLGIQVESTGELSEVYTHMENAKGKILTEGECTCCYAKSQKSWITDPQGVDWEVFYTHGESTVYGEGIHARPAPEVMEKWEGNDAIRVVPQQSSKGGCC